MTDIIEKTPLLEIKPEEVGNVRIRSQATNLLIQPENPGNVVLAPAYRIDRSGKVLYTFDLQSAGEKSPLDYTISLGNNQLYHIECITSTQTARAWTISRNGNLATELATLSHQLSKSQVQVRYSASGAQTLIRRKEEFESVAGNGGRKGKLNWRNTMTFTGSIGTIKSVDLECRDSKSWRAGEDSDYWAVINLDGANPFSKGKIHIIHIAPSQEAVDELVITGLAFMMLVRRALSRTARRKNRSSVTEVSLAQNLEDLDAKDFKDDWDFSISGVMG